MELTPEQTHQYILELQQARNTRLETNLSGEVDLETLVADAMNALELFYIVRRSIEDNPPPTPTEGGIKSQEIQPKYEE